MRHLLFLCFIFCTFSFCVSIAHADPTAAQNAAQARKEAAIPDSYTPIVGIPGINGNTLSTEQYINALYYMAISLACILAVYKIMEGGIKWMFDGLVSGKEEAKQQIQGAVFGLLIVLSAVVVLNTINVNLTNLNILGNAPSLREIERVNNPKSACSINSSSAACCSEKGGTYSVTTTGTSVCSNADAGIGITGDPDQDKITCETAGQVWDPTTNRCLENTAGTFDYNSIAFDSTGKYALPITLYEALPADKIQLEIELTCAEAGKSSTGIPQYTGTEAIFTCE